MKDPYARMTSPALVRWGGALVAVGIAYTALYLTLDWPAFAWIPALLCVSTGGPMLGTELRRRGVEEDRQTRERRRSERARARRPDQ